jgi:WD40 repeat protein
MTLLADTTRDPFGQPANHSRIIRLRHVLILIGLSVAVLAWLSLAPQTLFLQVVSFKGDPSSVGCVRASPDGKTLASCGGLPKTLRLWDVATCNERVMLKGDTGYSSRTMVFSSDSNTLAIAEDPGTAIQLRDVATGKLRVVLRGHAGKVWSIAFSPDGTTLASASTDTTVRLWDAATGHERACLEGQTDWVEAVAFSPDGKTLASGGWDRKRMVASGGRDPKKWGIIHLWDLGSRVIKATAHEKGVWPVWFLAFSPDGKTLASQGMWQDVTLRDAATAKEKAVLRTDDIEDYVDFFSFSPDGKTLAWVYTGGIQLWEVPNGRKIATFRYGHPGLVDGFLGRLGVTLERNSLCPHSLYYRTDGSVVAIGTAGRDDTTLKTWQVTIASGRFK